MRAGHVLSIAAVVVGFGCRGRGDSGERARASESLRLTHGVAIGDVIDTRAALWARASGPGHVHAVVVGGDADSRHRTAPATADHDFTAALVFDDLAPGARYQYAVWVSADANSVSPPSDAETGTLTMPPDPTQAVPIAFAWSGDLSGQNVCRDRERGFPIFAPINELELDFFVALGDMVYADSVCAPAGAFGNRQVAGDFGVAYTIEAFWAHWRYNRDDPGYRRLLSRVPTYAIWDDHEVANDFGPDNSLMSLGLRAVADYNALLVPDTATDRLYRAARWGRHVELFILDTRQHRAPNREVEHPADEPPKSLLGAEQRTWLEHAVASSDATWKIVVSSVPMSIPTGIGEDARDGWANHAQGTGFERELVRLLRGWQTAGVRGLVFITTDVHFATGFRYRPFPDAPEFAVHELVVGPLNAGLFPTREVDDTLHPERLFFHGPETVEAVTSFDDAVGWFNFGVLRVDVTGELTASVRDGRGRVVFEQTLAR